jgi:hypothetical protein
LFDPVDLRHIQSDSDDHSPAFARLRRTSRRISTCAAARL